MGSLRSPAREVLFGSTAETAEALFNAVKPRLGTEQGKPGRPDVGGDEEAVGRLLQKDFEEVARIEAENRPTVGGNVAEGGQGGVDLPDRLEIRGTEQVMDLTDLAAPFGDGADFSTENKTDGLGVDGGLHPRG